MSRTACIVLTFILLLTGLAHGQQTSSRATAVPRASSPITVDGKLGEPAWKSAPVITSFVTARKDAPVTNQTEVRLLFDDKALYIAFRCAEKNMARIKAVMKDHDSSVWEDDAVEVFLDTKGDRSGFVQFISNAIGTRYDGLGHDYYGYNPKWQAAAVRGKSEWTVEMRLPFGELGVPVPKPGDFWLGNFCREEQPSDELSSWRPTGGSFASTSSFGEIVFGALNDKLAKDLAAQAQAISQQEKATARLHVDASALLDDVKGRLKSARASASHSMSESGYLRVQALLNDNQRALTRVSDMIRRAEMGNTEYLVWETTPWRHFAMREDISAIRAETKAVNTVVLAGQTESKALMVTNLTNDTLSARLVTKDLPKDAVEILIPAFVRCADGSAFPDALIPPDASGLLTVPPGETRQIWLNIKGAKPGRIDGAITINPLTGSKTDKDVSITADVIQSSVAVPKPLAFTWDYLGDAVERGLEKEYVQTMADHGISVFMISGLRYVPRPKADDAGNILEPMDWNRFEQQVKLKWAPGRKLYITMDVWEKAAERPIFNGKFDTPPWRIAFKKVIGGMVGMLSRLGLSHEDYMLNAVDESIDSRYQAIARLIKEVDSKILVVEDTIGENLDQVKQADEYTDYWIPHFKSYRPDSNKPSLDYMKSTGKPVGFYFYSEGADEKARPSYRDYLWDFWFAYSKGLNGVFGYWTATQHYGDPWNRHQTTASYDPSLFYPGNGCVISGRRWEAWRRGIEDFALLKTCEAAGVDRTMIADAVKSVLDAPSDPDVAARARERLTKALQRK